MFDQGKDMKTERGIERWDAERGIHTLEPSPEFLVRMAMEKAKHDAARKQAEKRNLCAKLRELNAEKKVAKQDGLNEAAIDADIAFIQNELEKLK